MLEDVLGPRRGARKGASSSWQIACLWGSQCPYIALPLHPYPLDWFSIPTHQDVMESWGVWMDEGVAHTDSHSFLSVSPKISVITTCTHHTGEMSLYSGLSLASLLHLYNLSPSHSHFCPLIATLFILLPVVPSIQSILSFHFSTADWSCLLLS